MAVKTISKLIEIEWKIEIGGTFKKKGLLSRGRLRSLGMDRKLDLTVTA